MFGPKFASLVFSDTSIKIAVAKPSAKKFKVSFLASKELPDKTVFNGRIIKRDLFGEALKALFLENFEKIKTKNLVLGFPEQEVFLVSLRFEEKPKNLETEIKNRLDTQLPFSTAESLIIHKEISRNYYQVAAAKQTDLGLVSSLIEDAGFSLKAAVPLPLIFPKLIGEKPFPYLTISSEENLIFTLVVGNVVTFSSSFQPKNPLATADKEVVQITRELIEKEHEQNESDPLKKIFLHGSGTEYLKSFLSSEGFDIEVIFTSDKTDTQTGQEASNFGRVITLAMFDASVLSFPKVTGSKDVQITTPSTDERKINPIYLFLPLLLIAALTIFIFWPNLKDIFLKEATDKNLLNEPKKSATSASLDRREATSSASKEATKSAPKAVTKKDLKIRILNGSGVAGTADSARDFLTSKGYVVDSVGNADNFNYKKTVVQSKKSVGSIIGLLTKDLDERYAISIGSTLTESESFDTLIIIGSQ